MVCTGRALRKSPWFWMKMTPDPSTGHSMRAFNVLSSGATLPPRPFPRGRLLPEKIEVLRRSTSKHSRLERDKSCLTPKGTRRIPLAPVALLAGWSYFSSALRTGRSSSALPILSPPFPANILRPKGNPKTGKGGGPRYFHFSGGGAFHDQAGGTQVDLHSKKG
jgi:hypothetical protein